VEALEARLLFTSNVVVAEAYVGGSAWSGPFKDYLATRAGGSPDYGLGTDRTYGFTGILPWVNVDQITVTFTGEVEVDQADLTVSGLAVAHYPVKSFRYEFNGRGGGTRYAATWTLARPLGADRVSARLNVDGPGGVTVNGYPIGGGDRTYHLDVLPGDVNPDGIIVPREFLSVRWRLYRSVSQPGTGLFKYSDSVDLDGSGRIDSRDLLAVLRQKPYTRLPDPPAPAPAASLSSLGVFCTVPIEAQPAASPITAQVLAAA
jgi:hypothetical protein